MENLRGPKQREYSLIKTLTVDYDNAYNDLFQIPVLDIATIELFYPVAG